MPDGIELGDQVALKSGGPVMTVEEETGLHEVSCSYFDGKKLIRQKFPVAAIRKVSAEELAPPEDRIFRAE